MKPDQLRHLMQGLLFATAVTHLVVALLDRAAPMSGGLMIFGIVYGALAVWFVRTPPETPRPIVAAIAICGVGLTLGGISAATAGASVALLAMLLIDAVVIGAGLMWLSTRKKA